MSDHPDIETLRMLVKRDQEVCKAQMQRLSEIQQTKAEDLTAADQNSLQNWDKTVIKDCNRQLLALEDLESPTAAEREIMQELNKMISLGDHIMERRNMVHFEIRDKLNELKKRNAMKAESAVAGAKDEAPATPPLLPETPRKDDNDNTTAAGLSNAPEAASATPPTNDSPTMPIHEPKPETQPKALPEIPTDDDDNNHAFDPKTLYAIINVSPDAPYNEVKKAAKKAVVLLHPDRNPGNQDIGSRFAAVSEACKVFQTEETRDEFDATGSVEGIENLDKTLAALTLKE